MPNERKKKKAPIQIMSLPLEKKVLQEKTSIEKRRLD